MSCRSVPRAAYLRTVRAGLHCDRRFPWRQRGREHHDYSHRRLHCACRDLVSHNLWRCRIATSALRGCRRVTTSLANCAPSILLASLIRASVSTRAHRPSFSQIVHLRTRAVGYDRGPVFHPHLVEQGIWPWEETKPIGHIPQVRTVAHSRSPSLTIAALIDRLSTRMATLCAAAQASVA